MRKVRQWIDRMSVRKKLILYSYLTITPVLLVICLALIAHNYRQVRDERLENDRVSVHALAESWNMQQTDIKDFSTYICVNQEIHELLTCDDPDKKNENSRLWMDDAPMGIVQDMVALKGHIKTIAIYPENGVRPYLRGMDGSVNLATTDELRHAPIYQVAKNSENGMVWTHVEKGNEQIYEMNRTDKIVLYREIRDLAQKKTLGHITIGVSQEYFTSLSENALRSDEALLVLDRNGGVLSSVGNVDEQLAEYLQSEDFVKADYRKRGYHVKMLTLQNEPKAVQTWDSCIYTAQEQKEFLRDYMWRALCAHGLDDIEIYLWDHNKERVFEWAQTIIDDETTHMVAGMAFHWYSGDHFEALRMT